MSGKQSLRYAIEHAAHRQAARGRSMRRGTVTQVNPLVVQLHSYSLPITEDDDLNLSGWAALYHHVAQIQVGDMVLVQHEGHDWVVADVVPANTDVGSAFEGWKS